MANREGRILEAVRDGARTSRDIAAALREPQKLIGVYLCLMTDRRLLSRGPRVKPAGGGLPHVRYSPPEAAE